jgi:hypothetical protein
MKNNNYTVKELTDKIAELCTVKYPNDHSMKWAYTTGVLEAILDWEVKGYSKNADTLQDRINTAYLRYKDELKAEKWLATA